MLNENSRWQVLGKRLAHLLLVAQPLWILPALYSVFLSVLSGSNTYPWIGLGIASLPFPLRLWSRGYLGIRTPFEIPIAIFLLAASVSLLYPWVDLQLSLGAYQTLLACVLFYYLFANYDEPKYFKWGLGLACLGVLAATFFAYVQGPSPYAQVTDMNRWLFKAVGSFSGSIRAPSFAQHQIDLTYGLAIVQEAAAAILIGLTLFSRQARVRLTVGSLALLFVALVVLGGSRGAWLSLGVAVIFLLVWHSRRWLLSLPLAAGIGYLLASKGLLDFTAALEPWNLKTLGGRVLIWQDTLHMLRDFPATGLGLGHFTLLYPSYMSGSEPVAHAHSAYLQAYADLGFLGAIALMSAAIVGLKIAASALRAPRAHPWYGLAAGVAASILAVAVHGVVEAAPVGIPVQGLDGYHYLVSPLFLVLGGLLVMGHRFVSTRMY